LDFFSILSVKLNGGRHVQGILRGFDPFMNLVVDDCLEMGPGGQQNTIGMVVSTSSVFLCC
uniref:Sm protein G n=1 Tax=Stegastes partitus TaxID=144197 RepID=A0A3B4ZXV0_9TELE